MSDREQSRAWIVLKDQYAVLRRRSIIGVNHVQAGAAPFPSGSSRPTCGG
jgi:hypothetical protein